MCATGFTCDSTYVIPGVKSSSFKFMADSVVVVVDSRCRVLVARATVAMALRLHQGNCCYPPRSLSSPPYAAVIGWLRPNSLKVRVLAHFFTTKPYTPIFLTVPRQIQDDASD